MQKSDVLTSDVLAGSNNNGWSTIFIWVLSHISFAGVVLTLHCSEGYGGGPAMSHIDGNVTVLSAVPACPSKTAPEVYLNSQSTSTSIQHELQNCPA